MSENDTQGRGSRFTLRFPITLLEALKEIARAEGRSVEKQLMFILEGWPKEHGRI
mgnify:CR=1 FL=1